MKFSELPYERMDMAKVAASVRGFTGKIEGAASVAEAVAVMDDFIGLMGDVSTAMNVSNIRYTQNTEDAFYKGEMDYYAEAGPQADEAQSLFYTSLTKSRFRADLEKKYGSILFVNAEILAKTVSDKVLELLGEESKLCIEYQQVQGGISVEFEGKSYTTGQMNRFMTDESRDVRRKAHVAYGLAYEKASDSLEEIYDKLVKIRTTIARKLGFENFTGLGYCRMNRNSYNPEMVASFRAQVANELVPLVSKYKVQQKRILGVDSLKFHDGSVMSPKGNPAPICKDKELYNTGIQMYKDMNELTGELMTKMDAMETFDLYARKGKMSGGYCSGIQNYKIPFIFATFAGTAADVEVFTHEGGHAFADYLYMKNDGIALSILFPTLETCECHSMSMEFLCWPWIERFYGDRSDEAKVIHLLGALNFIPYGCMVDEFQHIVYGNPEMSKAQRNEQWLKLEQKYRPDTVDMDGLPFFSEGKGWQKQLHIFTDPFYYIDYCLAQTISMQFAAIMLSEGWQAAWDNYIKLAAPFGSMTFTQVVEHAGLVSPFEKGGLAAVTAQAEKYLDEHISVL